MSIKLTHDEAEKIIEDLEKIATAVLSISTWLKVKLERDNLCPKCAAMRAENDDGRRTA